MSARLGGTARSAPSGPRLRRPFQPTSRKAGRCPPPRARYPRARVPHTPGGPPVACGGPAWPPHPAPGIEREQVEEDERHGAVRAPALGEHRLDALVPIARAGLAVEDCSVERPGDVTEPGHARVSQEVFT